MIRHLFPSSRPHPSVGVQLLSGPLLVEGNYFYGFTPMGGREAYALGFYPQYPGQFCTKTTIGINTAAETVSFLSVNTSAAELFEEHYFSTDLTR